MVAFPKVSVTINIVQYLKRILLLHYHILPCDISRMNMPQASGIPEVSKEQETLEKISTNLISVNSDNVQKKIDEMFEMSAEILNFDSVLI